MQAIHAASLAACLLLPAPALAGGAIAVDHDANADKIVFGHAFNASPGEAAKEALAKCSTPNCKVMIKFTDKCGAFAVSKRQFGVGAGPTQTAAQQAAIENCASGDCKIAMAACE